MADSSRPRACPIGLGGRRRVGHDGAVNGALLVIAVLLVLPYLAFSRAGEARGQVDRWQRRLDAIDMHLDQARRALAGLRRRR